MTRAGYIISGAMFAVADRIRPAYRAVSVPVQRALWRFDGATTLAMLWLRDRGGEIRGCGCRSNDPVRCGGGDDDPCDCGCHGEAE